MNTTAIGTGPKASELEQRLRERLTPTHLEGLD